MDLDQWFKNIRKTYAAEMQCGKGCTACCHGLFDISLADAAGVARGFEKLPEETRLQVVSKAAALDAVIREVAGGGAAPMILAEDDPLVDRIAEAANDAPCPCLGPAGECLIYDDRPLACRLEGVPMVDVQDGLFGDWCELNFKNGVPASALKDLQLDYNAIDDRSTAVTFIPSVLSQFGNTGSDV